MNGLRIADLRQIDVEFYKNDARVRYYMRGAGSSKGRSKKDTVKRYSSKSMNRLSFVANNTEVQLKNMVTLTYPNEYPTNGKEVKSHLNKFLNSLRRKEISYLWFLEFQDRGAPHFHILINKFLCHKYAAQRWYEICDTGDERHLKSGTQVQAMRTSDGGARYATKYAYKEKQKECPDGFLEVGRFWGHSRDVKPQPRYTVESVTLRQLVELASSNPRAAEILGEWVDGRREFPLSLLFGVGRLSP